MANANHKPGVNVEEMVASINLGGRDPDGWQGKLILSIAFVWALFQLYTASNLPFDLADVTGVNTFIVTNSEVRVFHLAFALLLAALAFPLFKNSPRNTIPWYDWLLAALGVGACLYLLVYKDDIAVRAGLPTTGDLVASAIGMVVLAIAVFRALGLPLVIVATVFVCYVFFGSSDVLPDTIRWKGASLGKALWHYWMQTEGVFGVALGVSSSMIFLFVLFGSILEKAGAGNFFIKIAFALLGHFRGGPAKAAVVASAMSGLYSGSSIANTVTTGTFTIPLMKRTGFSAEKAGAIEVASSTNGQLMPPVMGAAAFLIAEFTGVPYTDIIKHAFLPAVVSYIALIYIVHLEALKLDLKGLPKPPSSLTFAYKILGFLSGFIALAIMFGAVYYGLGWIKSVMPNAAFITVALLCMVVYLALLFYAARLPDLIVDTADKPLLELPKAGETAITGLYYLLPIVILIWCIMLERLSPTLSAFWASIAMTIIALTQRPLKAIMRGSGKLAREFTQGFADWKEGMIAGSRNMIGIGVATAAAGIIIGTISLTGAHQIVGEFVEFLSGGHLMLMLILVAVMSLILGMGLPTTANYIVVSSLMAPVIVSLGASNGLIVPLVAVHLFVFYFGILADDTPPVGLAAFAAAAISGGDPIKTGIQGFAYDMRTALLPFLFLFNTELLLINVGPGKAIFIFFVAVFAMMLFASATQGYFLTRNKIWESGLLLLIAFTLFRPGFWLDRWQAPFDEQPGTEVVTLAGAAPEDAGLRLALSGPSFDDADIIQDLTLIVPLGAAGDGETRLSDAGLSIMMEDKVARLDEPFPGTPFANLGQTFDFYGDKPVKIAAVNMPAERASKEIFYIPALILFGLIFFSQRRRAARSTQDHHVAC